MVDLDADLANILGACDIGQTTASFLLSTGKSICVDGFFTDGTEAVSIMTGEIEAVNPMFDCQTSAVADVKSGRAGSTVTIDKTVYNVERKQNLGNGMTTVHLKTQQG